MVRFIQLFISMNKKLLTWVIISLILLSPLFLSTSKLAHASILDTILNSIKNTFSPSQQLSISSKIDLAPNGDLNKNGQITAGDTIKFTYVLSNITGNSYSFATLKTNINTTILNSLSNIQGTTSINDANHTITIPYVHLNPDQQLTISFTAQTNFNKDSNQTLSTQPEIIDQNNKSLATGQKQEVTVNKMSLDLFNQFVHITK